MSPNTDRCHYEMYTFSCSIQLSYFRLNNLLSTIVYVSSIPPNIKLKIEFLIKDNYETRLLLLIAMQFIFLVAFK